MDLDKEKQMEELCEEIDIILSVKDYISDVEINNFLQTFNLISENELREKLTALTGNENYINNKKSVNNYEGEDEGSKNKLYVCNDNDVSNEEKILDEEKQEIEEITYVDKSLNNTMDESHEEETVEQALLKPKDRQEIDNNVIDKFNKEEIKEILDVDDEETEEIVEVVDIDNIEDLTVIRGECKYGQLSVEWDWPKNVKKVLVAYRFDRFPEGPKDNSSFKSIISREKSAKSGFFTVDKAEAGDYYFSVFVLIECDGKQFFSKGQRRLITNRKPADIYYKFKINRTLFGKMKAAQIILSTDELNVELPQTVLVAKKGNIPMFKSEGEVIYTIDYQTLNNGRELLINIPIDYIGNNLYVKLFFLDDSNNKIYRIVCPTKENLYIK